MENEHALKVNQKLFDFPVYLDATVWSQSVLPEGRSNMVSAVFCGSCSQKQGSLSLTGTQSQVYVIEDIWSDLLDLDDGRLHLSDFVGWALLAGLELQKFTLDGYGILPHGQPLFGDGSTLCAGCKTLSLYHRLRKGLCRSCQKSKTKATPFNGVYRSLYAPARSDYDLH